MRIERLDLIAFGHLTDVTLDLSAAPYRFHLIVGENESGKSTTMRAIRSWLFGFDVQTQDDYVHNKRDLRVGGVLAEDASGDSRVMASIRRKRNKDSLLDGNDPEQVLPNTAIGDFLGGVDKTTFTTQFALDHGELTRGGKSILQGHGELGELLFAAGAGLGRLRSLQTELQGDIDKLLKPRGSSAIKNQLDRLKQLKMDLKEKQVPPDQYAQLQESYDAQEAEIHRVRQEHSRCSKRRSQLDAMLKAKPFVADWKLATSKLDPLLSVPRLAEDFKTRRSEVLGLLAGARETLAQWEMQHKEMLQQQQAVGDASPISSHQEEVAAILRELYTHEKNENLRVSGLQQLLDQKHTELRKKLDELAEQDSVSANNSTDVDSIDDQLRKYQLSSSKRNRITQLASDYGGLSTSVEEAKQQIQRIEQKIASVESSIDDLPRLRNLAIERVLDQVGSTKLLVDDYRSAMTEFDSRQTRCEQLARTLGGDRDFERWSEVIPPDTATLQKLEDQLQLASSDLRKLQEEHRGMLHQIEDAKAELDAVRTHTTLPSIEELDALRSQRDRELIRLANRKGVLAGGDDAEPPSRTDAPNRSNPTNNEEIFESVSRLVRQSDELADRMKQYQKEVLQQEHLRAKVAMLQSKATRYELKGQAAHKEQDLVNSQWESLWQCIEVEPRSPAEMQRWIDLHRQLVSEHDSWSAAKGQLLNRHRDIRAAVERLHEVLQEKDLTPAIEKALQQDPVKPLVELTDEAVRRDEAEAEVRRDRVAFHQKLETLRQELDDAGTRLVERIRKMDQWQTTWKAATNDLAMNSPSPVDVLPMLDRIHDLSAIMDDRDRTRDTMVTTENETRTYLQRIKRLLERVGEAEKGKTITGEDEDSRVLLGRAATVVTSLDEQAKREAYNTTERSRMADEIRKLENRIAKQKSAVKSHDATIMSLCGEAGCSHFEDLPAIEERSDERKRLQRQLDEAERELTRLADGQSLDEFISEVEKQDTDPLQDELRDVSADESELAKQLEQLIDDRGGIRKQLFQIDDSDEAAGISQDIATCIGGIHDDAETYIRLKIAAGILRQAIEHYRSENQAPVLKIAKEYFRTLTCQRYQDLKVDYNDRDIPVLHGVRQDTAEVPADAMSDGTADSLYLAFRLASLKHRCETAEPMPLIVDDCLLNLDDQRMLAAMKVFSELSRTTQVIMFSHHEFIIDRTKELQAAGKLHVHRLESLR